MRPLRTLGLVALALLPAVLPACSRSSGRTKVAFVSNNPYDFWKLAERGTQKAATDLGVDVEFKMPSVIGGAEEQQRIIEDLLTKGVQGIAISPNDAANQADFLRGVSQKVPLITVDSDVPDPAVRRCYLGTDNYTARKAVAD